MGPFAAECEAAGKKISTSKSEVVVLYRTTVGGSLWVILKSCSSNVSDSCSWVMGRWSRRLMGSLVQNVLYCRHCAWLLGRRSNWASRQRSLFRGLSQQKEYRQSELEQKHKVADTSACNEVSRGVDLDSKSHHEITYPVWPGSGLASPGGAGKWCWEEGCL